MTPPRAAPKTLRANARVLLARCPGWNGRLAARRLTQIFEAALAGTGLTFAQLTLMAQIAAADDDTLAALTERTGLEQSTLSRNLRMLERDGLVEIAVVEADQRRRMVWLTETGARRLEAAIPAWRQAQATLDDGIADLARALAEAAQTLVRPGDGR